MRNDIYFGCPEPGRPGRGLFLLLGGTAGLRQAIHNHDSTGDPRGITAHPR
jgi:hypothetical protein